MSKVITIIINFRVDGFVDFFRIENLPTSIIARNNIFLSENVKQLTLEFIASGTKMIKMYLLGSTIGWSAYPQFVIDGENKMLPRPVTSCRGPKKGPGLLETKWFKDLSSYAEKVTYQYVHNNVEKHPRFISM